MRAVTIILLILGIGVMLGGFLIMAHGTGLLSDSWPNSFSVIGLVYFVAGSAICLVSSQFCKKMALYLLLTASRTSEKN